MANVKFVCNAQVVLESGIIWDGVIVIKDGIIAQVGKARDIEKPVGAEVIDAKGNYVGPGFVDIHVHGGNGFDTCKNSKQAAEFFLNSGETTILATPAYHDPFKEYMEIIKLAKQGIRETKNIKGLYMEGPFININYGSYRDKTPWKEDIKPEIFKAFVDEAGLDAKVWTIAPERRDIMPFVEYARKVNPNVVFAVGHCEATPMQIRALGRYKPTLLTHSMCATGRIPVYSETRGYGPDEYCLKEPSVYCELISDEYGMHVHRELQQLILHCKGVDKVVLITDSTISKGSKPKEFEHVVDLNFDDSGEISGSKLKMNIACRNIMSSTNCGIAQAFKMASTNPATVVGMENEIGSIEVGKQADLVIVDDKFNVKEVYIKGNREV